LHQTVQRLVRGRRDDPYAVVSALAERLEDSGDPDAQLLAVVRSVATGFRSRYVRVELERRNGEQVVAEHGSPGPRTVSLPVRYRGEHIGRLVLSPAAGTRLSDADQRLLADVVRQAAAASRATQLAEELQASREALVTAREEERRRLRRDLHDGLGPALGAVSLRIETARNLAARAPERADALLADSVAEVSAVLADVRRLVHDLRPPALDEVGLVGALEQQVQRFRLGGDGVEVTLRSTAGLADLPAAVEVAAYRIVSEALANVSKHARAGRADVSLTSSPGALEVVVADDGVGIDPSAPAGVGLVSLRERAAELGGTVSVVCPPTGGTVVTAVLPLGPRIPEQPADAREQVPA
jgi:signal transduction histidine kinase